MANTLTAALALKAGERSTAERLMRESIAIFDEHQMPNSAAGVRRCLGLVLGGHAGRALTDAAHAELLALGIKNPARLTATWLPGFGGGGAARH